MPLKITQEYQVETQFSSTALLSKGDESKSVVAVGSTVFLTNCLGCLPLGLYDLPKAAESRGSVRYVQYFFHFGFFFLSVNLKSA